MCACVSVCACVHMCLRVLACVGVFPCVTLLFSLAIRLMVGRDLTHISSFSALVSFMEKSDSLLVLAQDTSTNGRYP